ncbi:hypothetical protein [Mycobacteroides abscessus]
MASTTARILPRPVRPLSNELLSQYLKRLAYANGLPLQVLKNTLRGRGGDIRGGLIDCAVLTERTIVFALPELREPTDLETYPQICGRTAALNIGADCPVCTRRRGVNIANPQIWSTHDNVVCRRHGMWLNGTAFTTDNNSPVIKLTRAAEKPILYAHRRHLRLLAVNGRAHTRQAVLEAYEILLHWTQWRLPKHIKDRHREIDQEPDALKSGPTQLNAAMYPEVIHLAELLTDTDRRKAMLQQDRDKARTAFSCVITLVLDGDHPYRAKEPLYQWRRVQQEKEQSPNSPYDDHVDEIEPACRISSQ